MPWAFAGVARSQAEREETPNSPNVIEDEKLLAALLNANQNLVDVFKCYHELEVAENAEEETRGHNHSREEQKFDTTVRIFQPWCSDPFDTP